MVERASVIRMSVVSGNNQAGTVGTQLATALVVQASMERPIENWRISWWISR
jgi:hypothetical protein